MESSDIRQEKIYTSYSAVQEEDKMRTDFVATFSTSAGEIADNSVRLTGGSTVSLDGQSMVENVSAIGGYSYLARRGLGEKEGNPKGDFQFEYIDNNGKSYKNKVSLPGKITISPPQEGNIATGFSVPWRTDSALGNSEKIKLTLKFQKGEFTEHRIFEDRSPSLREGRIEISAQELRELLPQRAELKICRNRSFPQLEAPAIGGLMEASYCTATVWILLK